MLRTRTLRALLSVPLLRYAEGCRCAAWPTSALPSCCALFGQDVLLPGLSRAALRSASHAPANTNNSNVQLCHKRHQNRAATATRERAHAPSRRGQRQ